MEEPNLSQLSSIAATCTYFHLRKASRAITQLFVETMKPSGLQGTQFSILVAVAMAGSSAIGDLAENLAMDRTTLTRTLKPLVKKGLLVVEPGEDQRIKVVSLTSEGCTVLSEAIPLWQEAQARIVENLGEEKWNLLLELLENLSDTANLLSNRCIYT